MSKLTLQAGSTFWFDYPADQPARWIYQGNPFTIDAKDFAQYAEVGTELLEGKLPEARPPKLIDRIVTKVAEVVGLKPDAPAKWPCPECSQVFNAERGLEIHIFNAHKELAESKKAAEIERLRANDKAMEAAQAPQVLEPKAPQIKPQKK